ARLGSASNSALATLDANPDGRDRLIHPWLHYHGANPQQLHRCDNLVLLLHMSDTRRNIAVLVGSSLAWREQIMRGIASFANENGAWNVFTAPEGEEYSVFSAAGQRWDGLIFRPAGGALVRRVLKLGIPVVSV